MILMFFVCATLSIFAQAGERWYIKKQVTETIIVDGDTLKDTFWDEKSFYLKNNGDTIVPLSFFLKIADEDFLLPEKTEGVMSAPSRKYAGFIQIPASLTIAEVRRLYGTKLGSRHDLHMFLNMHSTTEVVGDLLKKNPCVALGLSSLSEKKEITRTVVNVPSSKMTMFDDGITTTYRVPYDGEKRYSECASCSQTYVFQRKTIGTQLYQEVFYLTPGGAEFRGWNPDYVILPKGAWIFVTSDEDPLKW